MTSISNTFFDGLAAARSLVREAAEGAPQLQTVAREAGAGALSDRALAADMTVSQLPRAIANLKNALTVDLPLGAVDEARQAIDDVIAGGRDILSLEDSAIERGVGHLRRAEFHIEQSRLAVVDPMPGDVIRPSHLPENTYAREAAGNPGLSGADAEARASRTADHAADDASTPGDTTVVRSGRQPSFAATLDVLDLHQHVEKLMSMPVLRDAERTPFVTGIRGRIEDGTTHEILFSPAARPVTIPAAVPADLDRVMEEMLPPYTSVLVLDDPAGIQLLRGDLIEGKRISDTATRELTDETLRAYSRGREGSPVIRHPLLPWE